MNYELTAEQQMLIKMGIKLEQNRIIKVFEELPKKILWDNGTSTVTTLLPEQIIELIKESK